MDNKAASRKERMKEITDKLEAGIEEIYTSGKYTAWLDTMSRFHKYILLYPGPVKTASVS